MMILAISHAFKKNWGRMKFEDLEKTLLKFKSGEKSLLQTIQLIQIYENQNDVIDFKNRVIDDCDSRIASLEDIVRKLTAKFEYNSDGYCSICDTYHLQSHSDDCEFFKASAVLEGK